MAKCKHYKICGREADESSDEELCILHSKNLDKDRDDFRQALEDHRTRKSCDFSYFVFPEYTGFRKTKFTEWASFFHVKFAESADFEDAKFFEGVSFSHAKFPEGAKFFATEFKKLTNFADAKFGKETDFSGDADFRVAKFEGRVSFADASFNGPSRFGDAEFMMEADFYNATFEHLGAFARVTFSGITDFSCATFEKGAEFSRARFLSRTLFASNQAKGLTIPSFSGVEVDFREAIIAPLDALIIRDADLRKCGFLGTDLRKAEITGATWPKITVRSFGITISTRNGVYDEIVLPKSESRLLTFLRSFSLFRTYQRRDETTNKTDTQPWPHVERLYRELKQNYEERRDYERARDFHYGEKEMRWKNPETSRGLWFWLTLYKWVSGYGERWWPPLVCALVVFGVCTAGYLWFGLSIQGSLTTLNWTSGWSDWFRVADYSFRVMTLLKPAELTPVGCARYVNTFQSVAGPILFGLFALALRQRLRR